MREIPAVSLSNPILQSVAHILHAGPANADSDKPDHAANAVSQLSVRQQAWPQSSQLSGITLDRLQDHRFLCTDQQHTRL